MALSLTTLPFKEGFWPTVLNLSDQFRNRFSRQPLTVLSVSLVNGRFRAMSIINDSIHKSWEKPGILLRSKGLYQAIAEAIDQTEFSGTHISILVEDNRCLTLTFQLPIMPAIDRALILERKAQQDKTWEGPAVWRYHLGMHARNKDSVHLEVWPQSVIDQVTQACEDLNLQLLQLAPFSALSESQLSTLSIEPGEATILISIVEGKVTFIAAGEHGTPILTRHLAPAQDWVPLGERVGTEVNRTIMFITQQLNVNIPHIWFLSEEEQLTLEEVQPHVSTPILPCPITPDWKYWLWVGATLPRNLSNNFTPLEVRRAPLQKMLAKSLAAIVVGFVIVSVGATASLEGYVSKNQSRLQLASSQAQSLREDQRHWMSQLVAINTERQWAQAITESTIPSLEGPLLSYLGNIVPPQIILHKAVVKRTNDMWDLELAGRTSTNLSSTLVLMDQLVRQLAQGPYHVTVQDGWQDQLLSQTNSQVIRKGLQPSYQWTLKGSLS